MKVDRRPPVRFLPGPDDGAALVVVVLVLLAMTGLAHGMLVAARAEAAASAAGVRLLRKRAAAEGVLQRALEVPPAGWMDSVSLWGARTVAAERFGRFEALARYRRLGRESWLVEAGVSTGGGPATRTAALVWAMGPVARAAALRAVLLVDTGAVVLAEGPVDGTAFTGRLPPPAAAVCARWAANIDSVAPPFLPAVDAVALPPDGPRLGLLPLDSLVAHAVLLPTGTGTPAPVETLGRCETGVPWNWGDPDRPAGPCGRHLALRAAVGALHVDGGVGQGLLVVDGDVTLTAGARYVGLVLATGLLRLEDGAELIGAAIAAKGAYVSPTSRARGSACAVVRALEALRGTLGRPVLLEEPGVGPR